MQEFCNEGNNISRRRHPTGCLFYCKKYSGTINNVEKKERGKMRNYTTQMDAARKNIVTPEIEAVAAKENMEVAELMKLVA